MKPIKAFMCSKEEMSKHFEVNELQEIKLIVDQILTEEKFIELRQNKLNLKREKHINGDSYINWNFSEKNRLNQVCEAHRFNFKPSRLRDKFYSIFRRKKIKGPFTISLAGKDLEQTCHYHKKHVEIYISEHALSAKFKEKEDSDWNSKTLELGGLIIFSPFIVHQMKLTGLTFVIEIPAVSDDKYILKEVVNSKK